MYPGVHLDAATSLVCKPLSGSGKNSIERISNIYLVAPAVRGTWKSGIKVRDFPSCPPSSPPSPMEKCFKGFGIPSRQEKESRHHYYPALDQMELKSLCYDKCPQLSGFGATKASFDGLSGSQGIEDSISKHIHRTPGSRCWVIYCSALQIILKVNKQKECH